MPKKYYSRFFIRTRDRKKERATLFYRFQLPKNGIDRLVSSQISVNVARWQSAVSDINEWMRFSMEESRLVLDLGRIEQRILNAMIDADFSKEELQMKIMEIANPKMAESLRRLKEMEEERLRLEEERLAEEKRRKELEERLRLIEEDRQKNSIWSYLSQFCEEIADGTRLNNNQRYTAGTVKTWNSFKKLYEGFDPNQEYKWDEIDRKFVARFVTHLEEAGYMVKSINKYLVTFRCLVGNAYKDEVHDNDRALQFFSKKKVETHQKAVEIYLTQEELDALYAMKLTGKQKEIRDVFLIGCYTSQRVSDYSTITPDSFVTTAGGNLTIRFIQKKTNTEVYVPIMNPNLTRICERYNYDLPAVNDVVLNRYIKEILSELSKKVPSLAKMVPTQLTMKQRDLEAAGKLKVERNSNGEALMPRWACVTSHTARRTGITHMYLSKKYTILQMMKVSGHKTQKTFLDYIKLSSEELADEIAEIAKGE